MSTLEMICWASFWSLATIAPLVTILILTLNDDRLPQADAFEDVDEIERLVAGGEHS